LSVLAADIGGTSIRAALVDRDGAMKKRASAQTPRDPAEGYALLRRMWEGLGEGEGAAVVLPGSISTTTGEITQSPNLQQWEGTRPGEELACIALNDANGALLGEAWLGALKGRSSAVLLTLGTGVGGGVLIDGRLWTGATGCAGEIGHLSVDPGGPPCACGSRGCLELYASAKAVARAAGARNGADAADRARAGEQQPVEAFRQAGTMLGIAIANIINLLNPEAVCLAGGLTPAFDLLVGPLRDTVARRAFRLASKELEIVPATLGGDAGLFGAAKAAWERRDGSV